MISRLIKTIKSSVIIGVLVSGIAAQTHVGALRQKIATAIAAVDIEEALEAAEKADLSRSDMIAVRLAAFLETEKRIVLPGTFIQEKSKLAIIQVETKKRLIADLESYVAQLERSAPQSPELSAAAVTLAQMLQKTYSLDSSAKKRAAFQRSQAERATLLYQKALAIERSRSTASPDSLTIMLFLADRHMRSGNFEQALPLYEEYLEALEEIEGKESPARTRALIEIAKVSEAVGDIARLDKLKVELASSPVPYKEGIDLSPRAHPDAQGVFDPGGSVKYRVDDGTYVRDRAGGMAPRAVDTKLAQTQQILRRTPTSSVTSAKFSGGFPVRITVDKEGNVVSAEPVLEDSPKEILVSLVKKWKFRPLIYKGHPSQMEGIVYCWVVQ